MDYSYIAYAGNADEATTLLGISTVAGPQLPPHPVSKRPLTEIISVGEEPSHSAIAKAVIKGWLIWIDELVVLDPNFKTKIQIQQKS